MSEFISGLTTIEKMYFYVALFGTVLFILQSVFTFVDLGDSFNNDMDYDAELEGDFSFLGLSLPFHLFTIRGIVGFLMIFGMSGLSFSLSNVGPWLSFILACISGFIMMVIIGLIYYGASKLQSSGNVNINTAIGKECEVYLTIPPNKDGFGKVLIVLNGSLREYDAITYDDLIVSGEIVKVVAVMNDKLVVEKVNKENKL